MYNVFFKVDRRTVVLNPIVEQRLLGLIEKLGLKINQYPLEGFGADRAYNMITNYNLVDFDDAPKLPPQIISWCPPVQNWHPWLACNIDEGIEVCFVSFFYWM